MGWTYQNELGLTPVRTRSHRKVYLDRLTEWLGSKATGYEERNYDLCNDLVRITYEERHSRDWEGYRPKPSLVDRRVPVSAGLNF